MTGGRVGNISIENVLHFHQRQKYYISTQEKLCLAIMYKMNIVDGYVVFYSTIFETLSILKIDGIKKTVIRKVYQLFALKLFQ